VYYVSCNNRYTVYSIKYKELDTYLMGIDYSLTKYQYIWYTIHSE